MCRFTGGPARAAGSRCHGARDGRRPPAPGRSAHRAAPRLAVEQPAGHQVGEDPHPVHLPGAKPVAASSSRQALAGEPPRRRVADRPSGPRASARILAGLVEAAGERAVQRRGDRVGGQHADRRRPGAAVPAMAVIAPTGSSTYSSTLWHSTRSAPPAASSSPRSAASPCRARTCTPASAARRSSAASESGLESTTVTHVPRSARGTAKPPVPPPASTMSSRHGLERPSDRALRAGLPHDERVVPGPGTLGQCLPPCRTARDREPPRLQTVSRGSCLFRLTAPSLTLDRP